MRFFDYNDKMGLLKNVTKLKGTNIAIGEDYSVRVQSLRRNLWESSQAERANKQKVKLVYDKLLINGDAYVWNCDTAQRERLHAASSFSQP